MTSTTPDTSEIATFPLPRTDPFDPPPGYAGGGPVSRAKLWDGKPVWLVTGYDEARAALDENGFSADMEWPNFPIITPQRFELVIKGTFPRLDGEVHARYRRMLTKEFTVRKVNALRPAVEAVAAEVLDGMIAAGQPADLVRSFALPIPSVVICRLLGVPYAERAFFQERTNVILSMGSAPDKIMAAAEELRAYLHGLVRAKEREPGEDLISGLVADYATRGNVDHAEVVDTVSLLLAAGHETTANMISLSTFALLRHPKQFRALGEDPGLTDSAVEELLRYLTITQYGIPRVARHDITLGEQAIACGDGVIVMVSVANRDPSRFAAPDHLDVRRRDRGHLAFGFGVHQCVGQGLARMELQVALGQLAARLPSLHLAVPPEEVRTRSDMFVYGVHELPVAW
jgi:cytochrome P450